MPDRKLTKSQLAWLKNHGFDHKYPDGHTMAGQFSFDGPVRVYRAELSGKFFISAFSYLVTGKVQDTSIGRYCSIARDVLIGPGSHPTSWVSSHPFQYTNNFRFDVGDDFEGSDQYKSHIVDAQTERWSVCKPVVIGHDVWIANGALILPGVTIGTGAIISGRSVVTKDVPPYAVVGGSPAKVIRHRFDEVTIERLLASEWWRYAAWDLTDHQFHDVPSFLSQLEDKIAAGKIKPYAPRVFTEKDLPA